MSYGPNYNGVPIPHPDTRPDLAKPVLYWVPVIAPGNLMFYTGTQTFPQWDGNGFIGGMATSRSTASSLTDRAAPKPPSAGMWASASAMWQQGPDGSLWMLEDANPGALIHVTPQVSRFALAREREARGWRLVPTAPRAGRHSTCARDL